MSGPVAGAPDGGTARGTAGTGRTGSGSARVPGCELCEAARITPWHHEDDVCWVADCEVCGVPMVVWRHHGTEPPPAHLAHMLRVLANVADRELGSGTWSVDRVMRQVPDHFHAHARDPGWWFRRTSGGRARGSAPPPR